VLSADAHDSPSCRSLILLPQDFGVSDVFRMCWEKKTHLSKGLCGSEPYIAPEQFESRGASSRVMPASAVAC
jgi:protein-serine/threonine kinase